MPSGPAATRLRPAWLVPPRRPGLANRLAKCRTASANKQFAVELPSPAAITTRKQSYTRKLIDRERCRTTSGSHIASAENSTSNPGRDPGCAGAKATLSLHRTKKTQKTKKSVSSRDAKQPRDFLRDRTRSLRTIAGANIPLQGTGKSALHASNSHLRGENDPIRWRTGDQRQRDPTA